MNKLFTLTLMILILVGTAQAAPVKITNQGEAYGHHGACGSWNGCSNAEQCAQMVCNVNGFSQVVSYESSTCFGGAFDSCRLFNNPSQVDCDWSRSCDVPVVTDIWCDDGEWTPACLSELPPQNDPPTGEDVPEFTLIGSALIIVGALGFLVFRRKK